MIDPRVMDQIEAQDRDKSARIAELEAEVGRLENRLRLMEQLDARDLNWAAKAADRIRNDDYHWYPPGQGFWGKRAARFRSAAKAFDQGTEVLS